MGFFDRIKKSLGGSGGSPGKGAGRFPADMKDAGGHRIVFEGPFPIATPEGRLICKNCGTTFDWATVWYAQATYVSETNPDSFCSAFCRKCSTRTAVLREDVAGIPPLPGMTKTARSERTYGDDQIKFCAESPLPLFDPAGRLLCRYCGVAFTEQAYEQWRNHIPSIGMLAKGLLNVQCTYCVTVSGFAVGNDARLLAFAKELVKSLPD